MSERTFQFSPAALLYCQNFAVVEEIRRSSSSRAKKLFKANQPLISEMRAMAYQDIATHGGIVLDELSRLPWEQEKVCLCQKRTHTTKSYAGQSINYRWLEPVSAGGKKASTSLAVFLPIPDKIKSLEDDGKLVKFFEIITGQHYSVYVYIPCTATTEETLRKRIVNLCKDGRFGDCTREDKDGLELKFPIDLGDPVAPAVKILSELLRAICAIEYAARS